MARRFLRSRAKQKKLLTLKRRSKRQWKKQAYTLKVKLSDGSILKVKLKIAQG